MIGCPPSNSGGSHWTTQDSSPTLRIFTSWGGSGTSEGNNTSCYPLDEVLFLELHLCSAEFREIKLCLTHNFHIYVCSVLSSQVSNHDRVDSLVLPLGPLDGEDAVTFGGLYVNPAVSIRNDLRGEQLNFDDACAFLIGGISPISVMVCASCGGLDTCPESLTRWPSLSVAPLCTHRARAHMCACESQTL